jgi:hypothetical protein
LPKVERGNPYISTEVFNALCSNKAPLICSKDRAGIAEWMIKYSAVLGYCPETYHLALAYFDMTLEYIIKHRIPIPST